MADRPEVATAPAPIAAIDLLGLAESMGTAFLRVPFRQPWRGAGNVVRNVGVSVTREMARSFLGYATSLPVDEFRSIEKTLDTVAGAVLRAGPFVARITESQAADSPTRAASAV